MKYCLICIGITLSTCNAMHTEKSLTQFNSIIILFHHLLSHFCFQHVEFRFASGIFERIHERKTIQKKWNESQKKKKKKKTWNGIDEKFYFSHTRMNAHSDISCFWNIHFVGEHVHVLTNVLNCGKWIVQLVEQQQQQQRRWCHQTFSLCCIYALSRRSRVEACTKCI